MSTKTVKAKGRKMKEIAVKRRREKGRKRRYKGR